METVTIEIVLARCGSDFVLIVDGAHHMRVVLTAEQVGRLVTGQRIVISTEAKC